MSVSGYDTVAFTEPFCMGKSEMIFLKGRPQRISGCLVLSCESGSAELNIDITSHKIGKESFFLLLPGSTLELTSTSSDLSIRYCYIAEELFYETTYKLSADFFQHFKENPSLTLDQKGRLFMSRWFQFLEVISSDSVNIFYTYMIGSQLRCMFCELGNQMALNYGETGRKTRRQDELYHEFMALVKTYCRTNRNVAFYADRLFISSRYLSFICTKNSIHSSAKKVIDMRTVLEIKILLETSSIPVQKIAEIMRFPDQSYLGRFFKRHTGESPLAYRARKDDSK